ncbi:MAG: P-II family nitrogen regulator [Thermoleophilia bacterium]|nr:P-II family nitrogen regulator [Thermoleophilia bacterium]MDH4340880.1 P-II family nitrogen regulator [Thermoleophilia bacterium]MDH5282212.1 P-II family nitrogen regulator [Thermoleophilia bacterium]
MKFKGIIALVDDDLTERVIDTARKAGATGCTVISSARGEGLEPAKTFFGLNLESQRDFVLFIVEQHLSRHILERIADVGGFDKNVGAGVAFQFDVEDVVGLASQMDTIEHEIEDQI